MALGDNFYEDGIDNTTDPLWRTAYHNIYKAESLQIPWYPILGNHDYHVDPQAQIDRTYSSEEDIWTMPARYYVLNYSLPDGGIVSIVNIDTQLIDTGHDDTSIIYSNPNWKEVRTTHLQWIDRTLAEQSKIATWVLVAGHYPIYSVGVNGDNSILLDSLQPILEKHEIHAYIAGHDHNNQYFTMDDGITYIVSGQGSGRGPFGPEDVKFYGTSASTNHMQHHSSECGFSFVKMTSETMNVSYVNVDGKITFTGVLSNPHTLSYRQKLKNNYYYDYSNNNNDDDDGSGSRSGSGGSRIHYNQHRIQSKSSDNSTALTIFLPGLFLITLLVFYVGRNTPQMKGMMSHITQTIESIQNLLHASDPNEKISPSIDVSTRSDVGLTSDMDRSGRRHNSIQPRNNITPVSTNIPFDSASLSGEIGSGQYRNTSYLPPQSTTSSIRQMEMRSNYSGDNLP